MRFAGKGIAWISAAAVLGACEKQDGARAHSGSPAQDGSRAKSERHAPGGGSVSIQVRTDTAPLADKIRFPSPPAEVRWVETARTSSRAPGPTDTRLWVLVKPAAGQRAAWEQALGAPIGRSGFHLEAALADSLLGANAAASLALDSLGRSVPGPYFRPDSLTTSWYGLVAAAWIGESILLESASK
jgi:hypothetical protein